MKAVINIPNSNKPKFPCLMMYDNDGLILLATSVENGIYTGTVVDNGTNDVFMIGDFGRNWCSRTITPFEGTITLSNN